MMVHLIEYLKLRIIEECDALGSIAVLYYYKEKWHVASSSVPDGSSMISKELTFVQVRLGFQ